MSYECQSCGVHCERPPTRGQRPKWCPECRRRGLVRRACARCGHIGVRYDARFCSRRCAGRRRGVALVHVGPAPSPTWEPAQTTSGRVWVAGPCEWCSTPFVIVDQIAARFCSKRCASAAGKYRRGRFLIPARRRLAIYERDGWTCQLCLEPIDSTLGPSDPWAATLDHIVCQSWGQEPDHSDENLRLAHRWCNSVRADERFHTVDVLRVA
jgi:hypothetical protein